MGKIILAIDPGVKCAGWCVGAGGCQPRSGHTERSKKQKSWPELWAEVCRVLGIVNLSLVDVAAVEAVHVGLNVDSALALARCAQMWHIGIWVLACLEAVEAQPTAWQAAIGSRRSMGEDAWQAALLEHCEALGGQWGELEWKGKGKSKVAVRCPDELSARGIWSYACGRVMVGDM